MRKANIVTALIALALVAGVVSIAVPNVLTARNRSRQKRTMADMRTIATAWEARATDRNSYTVEPDRHATRGNDPADFAKLHSVPVADLERALVPRYIRKLPRTDGWGNEFDLRTGAYNEKGEAQSYAIRSFGNDGRADGHLYKGGVITNFKGDLVYANGSFLQFPEGI